jgi:sphinganine-1-phosphate aldolase
MEAAITPNTVVLIGSAPCYPQGTMDPLSEISAMALKYKVNMHVDGCLGGFLLPFVERLG